MGPGRVPKGPQEGSTRVQKNICVPSWAPQEGHKKPQGDPRGGKLQEGEQRGATALLPRMGPRALRERVERVSEWRQLGPVGFQDGPNKRAPRSKNDGGSGGSKMAPGRLSTETFCFELLGSLFLVVGALLGAS